MAKREQSKISTELLDELLSGRDPTKVLSSDGLMGDLKKALAERILQAEMDVHLDNDEQRQAGNHRNGTSQKSVLTDDGRIVLDIPRDRHGQFDPAFIQKYQRRFPGFDEKIISLYANGMSVNDHLNGAIPCKNQDTHDLTYQNDCIIVSTTLDSRRNHHANAPLPIDFT